MLLRPIFTITIYLTGDISILSYSDSFVNKVKLRQKTIVNSGIYDKFNQGFIYAKRYR
jgi:hypothetical protein